MNQFAPFADRAQYLQGQIRDNQQAGNYNISAGLGSLGRASMSMFMASQLNGSPTPNKDILDSIVKKYGTTPFTTEQMRALAASLPG